MKKTRWLDRSIAPMAPHMVLCTSEKAYLRVMKYLKVQAPPQWVFANAHATTHILQAEDKTACVVCLRVGDGVDELEVLALLVHEAVHVWQAWCEQHGETHPGSEQEAYAVQHLSHTLMSEWRRQQRRAAKRRGKK